MSNISIVVPVLGNLQAFEETLASILCHQPDQSELIVIHPGDYQDPYDLEFEGVKFLQTEHGGHWTESVMQASANLLDSEIVHTICPGIQVDEGWCDEAIEVFADSQVATAAPILVSESEPNRVVTLGIGKTKSFRRKLLGQNLSASRLSSNWPMLNRELIGPTSWCGFYRRQVLEAIAFSPWSISTSAWDQELGLCCQKLGLQNRFLFDSHASLLDRKEIESEFHFANGAEAQTLLQKFQRPTQGLGKIRAACDDALKGKFSLRAIKHGLARFSVRPEKESIENLWQKLVQSVQETCCHQIERQRKAA